ncbi:major facilitator superfamily domain-containing protein [Cokeromyces recurvatus]|uniref:major facilitator superfamily domain-containing protein n=1 Tax=Cokeromyces recurvatus TaxID=90255 RepID=UPI00221F8D7C|nr:major facilitator superfamily domain-containing protein [Cokeromyces recurvatus]KAI7901997.1 major facilitator superfamily domain-containing protein [Cokeromyces recurvatus]
MKDNYDKEIILEENASSEKSVSNETSLLAWIELIFVILLNMSVNLRWLTFSPVASLAAEYMNVSMSSITWLANCATLIFIAISTFTGWVFERYGMKACFLFAACTSILGSWIRYFGTFAPIHQRYAIIMFGQCIASIAEPFIMNIGTHFAAVWFATHHRVTANTLLSLPLGMIVATLSMPKLVQIPSELPRALLITACISTAFGIPFLILPSKPKIPPTLSAKVTRTSFRESLKSMLRNRNYLLLIIIFSINFAMFASIVAITSSIFIPQGFSTVQAGLASFIRIISGIGGALIAGRITDWTGQHALVLKIAAPMTAITTVILYIQDLVNTYAFMMVSCFLNGFFVFLIIPVSLELAAECTFPVSESVSASILWGVSQVSSFCTTFIMDALRAGPDASPPYNMKHALIYAIVLSCIGAIPSFFLSTDLKRIHRDRTTDDKTIDVDIIQEIEPTTTTPVQSKQTKKPPHVT